MSWTKRQIIMESFDELGFSDYDFDSDPGILQSALRKLDALMEVWNARGIKINYPLPDSPENSNLDADTEVPGAAVQAIYLNLAVRIGPSVGKMPSPELKIDARDSYNALLLRFTQPIQMKLPKRMPVGSGNKPWRNDSPFVRQEDDNILLPPDNEASFYGQ